MAISTYAELQTAVQNWLDDTSLSSRVPEFITLGEGRINRDLGAIRMAWSNTTLTGTTSSRSVALPSDFIEAQALYLTTYGTQDVLQPFINGTMELDTTDGIPAGWSVNGSNIDLDCPCSQAHTFLFRYRAKWGIAASSTNWLLTNYPDIYLASSLIEAFDFRRNFDETVRWESKYKSAVHEIEEREAKTLSLAPLRVDGALLNQNAGSFNYSIGQ